MNFLHLCLEPLPFSDSSETGCCFGSPSALLQGLPAEKEGASPVLGALDEGERFILRLQQKEFE